MWLSWLRRFAFEVTNKGLQFFWICSLLFHELAWFYLLNTELKSANMIISVVAWVTGTESKTAINCDSNFVSHIYALPIKLREPQCISTNWSLYLPSQWKQMLSARTWNSKKRKVTKYWVVGAFSVSSFVSMFGRTTKKAEDFSVSNLAKVLLS